MEKLSDLSQKAITAFKVIQNISKVKYVMNTEFLYDERESDDEEDNRYQKTQQKIKKLNNEQILLIRDKLLMNRLVDPSIVDEQNYEQVMGIFRLGQGLPVEQLPSQQISVLNAADDNTKKLVFCPSSTTVKLFQSFLKDDRRVVIFGSEGIGKRISTLLFAHLSTFVTAFKLSENPQQIASFVNLPQLLRIPKVLYHSIESPCELSDIVRHVWMQLSEFEFPSEEYERYKSGQRESPSDGDSMKFLSSLLQRTKKKCQEKKIPLCVVVNDANVYSGLAQNLAKSLSKQERRERSQESMEAAKLLMNKITDKIIRHSNYLKLFSKHSSKLVLITSKVDTKDFFSLIRDFWKEDPLFNINFPITATQQKLHSSFPLSEQYEQIQMFLLLLFEFKRKLQKYSIALSEEEDNKLTQIYKKLVNAQYESSWSWQKHVWTPKMTHRILNLKVQGLAFHKILKKFKEWQRQKDQIRLKQFFIYEFIEQFLSEIENDYNRVSSEYKTIYLESSKQKRTKISRLISVIYAEGRYAVKDCHSIVYSNRFVIENNATNARELFGEAVDILIDQGLISIEGEKVIVNSSPYIIREACQFAFQQSFDNLFKSFSSMANLF